MATAVEENNIDVDTPKALGVIPLNSGGFVSATLVASFGQAFAGSAFSATAESEIVTQATGQYNNGAKFLNLDDIFKKGLIDPANLDTLTGISGALDGIATFSEADLIAAEINYRRALLLDPFDIAAAEGILNVRRARVLKNNLVSDYYRKREFIKRYTDIDPTHDTTGRVIAAEIAILENIVEVQKSNLPLLLELVGDPLFNGPGALLRGELTGANPDIVGNIYKLLYSSAYRYAQAQYDLGQKRLLLNFFNSGGSADQTSRIFAAEQLLAAHDYITALLQVINPYVGTTLLGDSDLYRLTGQQAKLRELATLTQQGYNPFGFLPEFVPFVKAASQSDNLSTFNAMQAITATAVDTAKTKEQEVATLIDQLTAFTQTEDQFHLETEQTAASYQQRLKSLAGTVTINGNEEADVLTAPMPDEDIDGDGKTERDKLREDLTAKYGFIFGAKGQIAEQHQILAAAKARIEQALNQMKNNVAAIADKEQEAREISGVLESTAASIINIVKSNGEKVGALIHEKGKLLQDYEEEQLRIAEYNNKNSATSNIFAGAVTFAAGAYLNNPAMALQGWTMVGSGMNQYNASMGAFPIQSKLADIDARVNDIKTAEQADITLVNMQAEKAKLLINTKFAVKELVRQQANLRLDYYIAQRDYYREQNAIANRLGEIHTLLADSQRLKALAERVQGNISVGWYDQDVRDVLTNKVLIADQALMRAKVWSYVALQALSYYANLPPQASGQINAQLLPLYRQLYFSRRADDLKTEVLDKAAMLAGSDFVFNLTTTACQARGLLSLKYDVFASTNVLYDANGNPYPGGVTSEGLFRFRDPDNGVVYEGARGYQALLRKVLRDGLSGQAGSRKLTLVFATDLFPRKSENGVVGSNPFYLKSAVSSKVTGFQNPNCLGTGVPDNAQGIQVNLTGAIAINSPFIKLAQRGNSYLKHTQWDDTDFNAQGKLNDPLKKINVYSSYQQLLPSWLIDDINPTTTSSEARIGSDVTAVFQTLRNGQGPAGKALAFTDRSVANDRWEFIIEENENANNSVFFDKLEQMLNTDVPLNPTDDFLTDIQLWTGWAYRNPI